VAVNQTRIPQLKDVAAIQIVAVNKIVRAGGEYIGLVISKLFFCGQT